VNGYSGPRHPEVLDPACVSRPVAAYGGHVIGARVEASRNLTNFCFPSAMTLDERADLERIVTKVLLEWEGDLAGDYFPLSGSGSFVAYDGGMTAEDASDLESHGFLFQAPSSAMFLSSGMGKHWPQARGVYANSSRDMAIWINEEDHLRLIATASSPQKAFDRFCALEGALKLGLQHEGLSFASHEAFGFLTSCPSRVGTGGFQVGAQLKLALVEDAEDRHFEDVSSEIESQGVLQMKATARIGQSEADMVQAVVSACEQLIAEEIQLATGLARQTTVGQGAVRSNVVENFSAKLNSIRFHPNEWNCQPLGGMVGTTTFSMPRTRMRLEFNVNITHAE
ncbi:tck1, partial [Symbiodinium necroappetens]